MNPAAAGGIQRGKGNGIENDGGARIRLDALKRKKKKSKDDDDDDVAFLTLEVQTPLKSIIEDISATSSFMDSNAQSQNSPAQRKPDQLTGANLTNGRRGLALWQNPILADWICSNIDWLELVK